jgi:hypothetical protein
MDDEQTGPPIGSEVQTDDERPEWICVDCQTANPADAKQCAKCGYVLSAHTPTPGSGPLTERPPAATDASPPLPPPTPRPSPALLPTPATDGQAVAAGLVALDRADAALVPVAEESVPLPVDEAPTLPAGDQILIPPPDESAELPPAEPVVLPVPLESPASTSAPVAIVAQPVPIAALDADSASPSEPTAPITAAPVVLAIPAAPAVPPSATTGVPSPASPTPRRVAARPRPPVSAATPARRPPGRLARAAPETLLLVGAAVSVIAWALIALDETTGETGLLGLVGLGLGAVGIYVLAVGLIQAVLRRDGRRF